MPQEHRRLHEQLQVARAIIAVQRQIQAAGFDVSRVMSTVTATAQRLVGADGAVVELLDGDEMLYQAVAGAVTVEVGFRIKARGSLSGMCVDLGTPLRCDDAETDVRVDRDACLRVGARSMVVVPLVTRGQCVGVLKVISGRPAAFGDEDIEILEELASFIASALLQAQRYADRDREASHDPLTGLLNRRSLLERLDEVAWVDLSEQPLTVFFVDLDRFKAVNDTYGHGAGDDLLADVARRLRECVRATDLVARIGGDEFVVVCAGLDDSAAGMMRARLDTLLAGPLAEHGAGASVGAVRRRDGEPAASLLDRADAQMYAVKAQRRAEQAHLPVG